MGRAVELEVDEENLEACRLAAAEETAAEVQQPLDEAAGIRRRWRRRDNDLFLATVDTPSRAASLKSELKPYSDNLFAIDDFKSEFSIVGPPVNSSSNPGVIFPGWPASSSLNTNENSTVIDVSSSAGLTRCDGRNPK